ncbi:hypothetical protein F5141DRAFT_1065834 [Pisolithus sp. B1]|nr:hypothetical protein F5141DRAFT_1065834 [Pisolithus sp. B1]
MSIKGSAPTPPVHSSHLSSPQKSSKWPSRDDIFQFEDGGEPGYDIEDPPVEPLRLPWKKIPQKDNFLKIILEMEAPLEPHTVPAGSVKRMGVQQWTGDYFEDAALHMTALKVKLGHGGAPCPSAIIPHGDIGGERLPRHLGMAPGNHYQWMMRNGKTLMTHHCNSSLQWDQKSYHLQLLHTKLFLSTFEKPSTAFTFAVLDDFLRDNLECRTSGMNYYSKLYCELLWIAWQWRLLKQMKWNGFQALLADGKKGRLALFCMACPQPGINVDPTVDLMHWKYTCTLVMDGNFKAEHMHDKCPEDQEWLMDRLGFMVNHSEYQAYLKATPHIAEKSSCNNHSAISQANAARGKLDSMGIGAAACAWHGCFYPHSVVDFQKGERQLNMDYSLVNALSFNMDRINNIICFYDINCSYMKNLRKQVDNSRCIDIPNSLQIILGIGIWHVHGHKKECYTQYVPLFIKGVGWVDSEIIKMLWSMLNIVSVSACSMSAPHRQELLDFQINDSNFMKMIQIVDSLSWKLKGTQASLALAVEAFQWLDESVPRLQWTTWCREETALREWVHDSSAMDIFEIQLQKGKCTCNGPMIAWNLTRIQAPTVWAMELDLIDKSQQTGTPNGVVTWLAQGIRIEEVQLILKINTKKLSTKPRDINRLAITRTADWLASEQSAFIAEATFYMGQSCSIRENDNTESFSSTSPMNNPMMSSVDTSDDGRTNESVEDGLEGDQAKNFEMEPLPLPSLMCAKQQLFVGIESLAEMEVMLCIGWDNEALHGLRLALADKAMIFHNTVHAAKSYTMKTRAWEMIHAVDNTVKKQATIYWRCQDAIVSLGAGPDILNHFQLLCKDDLTVNTVALQQNDYAHFYQIHWLWAKAVWDRWAEEKELLTSKFQWVIGFFRFQMDEWRKKWEENGAAGS